MLSGYFDPTWAVPLICVALAGAGLAWATLSERAEDRRRKKRP